MDDLFSYEPRPPVPSVASVIAFPLSRRVGKVRDVAAKIAAKKTRRHAEFYRKQVDEGLRTTMARQEIEASIIESEMAEFWQAVAVELARLRSPHSRGPGVGDRRA